MKLFVAKLNREVRDEDLVELFSQHGEVAYARVVTDRDTAQSKCFGFVQMRDAEGGKRAMDALNGQEFRRFPMVVKEAEERPRDGSRPPSNAGTDSRKPAVNRDEQTSAPPRSDRFSNSTEFSRIEDAVPPAGKRAGITSKKGAPDRRSRDIYQDGPRQPKVKRDKPKNADWLDDLDDE